MTSVALQLSFGRKRRSFWRKTTAVNLDWSTQSQSPCGTRRPLPACSDVDGCRFPPETPVYTPSESSEVYTSVAENATFNYFSEENLFVYDQRNDSCKATLVIYEKVFFGEIVEGRVLCHRGVDFRAPSESSEVYTSVAENATFNYFSEENLFVYDQRGFATIK
jgi:hypothetical protein